MCFSFKGFIEILFPIVILISALCVGIGYKLINKKATLDDAVEQEVIKIVEKEAEDIVDLA